MSVKPFNTSSPAPPAVLSGILMGIGLGGLVDGIVLHQILQWHHMLTATGSQPSDTVAGLQANTLADGLFHLFALGFVLAGALVAVRDWRWGRRSPPMLGYVGLLLIGWATFNFVEGVINHHLLRIHHVRDDVDDPTWWDLGFLAASAAMLRVGALLLAVARRDRLPTITRPAKESP